MTLVKEAPLPAKSATLGAAPWKTVLVHVEPGKAAGPRLEAAVDLAKRSDALLIGLGAEMLEPVTFSDPYGSWDGAVITALRDQIQQNIAGAEAAFRKASQGVSSEWRHVEDRPVQALARVARGADVIVAGGAPLKNVDGYRSADAAELALVSGRPVLVAPPSGGTLKARSVVVAWKETRESRRALADALAILLAAEEVLVLEVCSDPDGLDDASFHAQDVAEGLKRHGVKARAKAAAASEDRIADTLQTHADVVGADLIVAGCFGHSRMNEWFFGGVTRDLLHNPQRFLLISH